jgi:hypothetical protein
MKHETAFRGFRGTLAFTVSLLLTGIAFEASPQSASTATRERPEYITGTVRAVDAEARTFEILTGVGHVVRLVRMQVAPDCEFRVPGAAPRLTSITQGACVRVASVTAPTVAPSERVAVAIEVLAIEERGRYR